MRVDFIFSFSGGGFLYLILQLCHGRYSEPKIPTSAFVLSSACQVNLARRHYFQPAESVT